MLSGKSKAGKAILSIMLIAGMSGTAFAQNMIVKAVGPSAKSYPAGKKLAKGTKVTLQRLDRITILNKGGTRVLKGPGTFTIGLQSRARTGATTRLSSFISNRNRGRARTGAVRNLGTDKPVVPKNPNLWYLDITRGGKFCVSNPNALVLWRPDLTGSATASIVNPDNGSITKVDWVKGFSLKAWPRTEAPVTNGAKYQLLGSNVEKSAEIDFVILDKTPTTADEVAEVLLQNGCQGQFDQLVERLDPEPATDEG